MYNNFSQTPPYYYGYGLQQYQRPMAPTTEAAPTVSAQPSIQSMMVGASPAAQNFIKGRPVVSIDEARASQIDLDGSLYVFPDLGNKKIYTKQINLDGTATFNVFELVIPSEAPSPSYVTREELDEILSSFKTSLAAPVAPQAKAPTQSNQIKF